MKVALIGFALTVVIAAPPALARQACDTALLLDVTDRWGSGHTQALAQSAAALKAELHFRDGVSVFALRDRRAAQLLWSRGCPRRGSDANPIFAGAGYAEEEFLRAFAAPFDSTLRAALAVAGPSHISALVEALRQITCFSSFARSSAKKRLIIFSDLIQNTPEFSLYERHNMVRPDGSPLFPDWSADLRNVDVEVYVLLRDRDAGVQGLHLINQWRRFLLACGARSVTFTEVSE